MVTVDISNANILTDEMKYRQNVPKRKVSLNFPSGNFFMNTQCM